MKSRSIFTIAAICAVLMPGAYAFGDTRVIKGTVVASPGGAAYVQVRSDGKLTTVTRSKDTVITRGEAGEPSHAVALREFQRGDQFVGIIEDGTTVSMKATYAAVKTVGPFKINSVTFSAPVPLKGGDIITVDMAGTRGAKAAFAVKGLFSVVKMTELSPGSYHGSVAVPKNKTVRNAPLVGYLGVGDVHAAPVQASRLVTVGLDQPLPNKVPPLGFVKTQQPAKISEAKPQPAPEKKPQASSPAPAAQPIQVSQPKKVEEPKLAKIVLTNPPDGTVIRRVILVRGTAEPGASVRVTITYSNGMTGLLKLAGDVASENVSVGKNGEFRMGPIALDGPLATNGLKFAIKAYYADRADHATAEVGVTGNRD